jgi:hypothetical protein
LELNRLSHDLIELTSQRVLFVSQPLRITDDVEEQNVDDFQLDFLF